jgi:hypothetical protein
MDHTPDAQPDPETRPERDREPQESGGLDVVDTVAGMLEQLDHLPVAEHVAVFERAHESLRGALSDAASTGPVARA